LAPNPNKTIASILDQATWTLRYCMLILHILHMLHCPKYPQRRKKESDEIIYTV
jgi:hypothetical protein